MKIGRILREGVDGDVARLVLVRPQENHVIDLKAAYVEFLRQKSSTPEAALRAAEAIFPGSMKKAIGLGDVFLDIAHEIDENTPESAILPLDQQRWLPATDPKVLRDGLTFVEHIKGFHEKMGIPPAPSLLRVPGYFKGTPQTIIGQDDDIPWPGFIEHMDYELELGWIIGRRGSNLDPVSARKHLFGITIFNDCSARDRQSDEMAIGMGPQKCKDFAYAVGPWITTIDEFDDLNAIPMEVRINGETWGKGDSGNTLWSVDELIAYVSQGETIEPGDLIGSGTMGGGSALELGKKLNPGDLIEMEVGGIGVLRNRVGKRQDLAWWPSERQAFM